jgi:HEAT repeat protein
VQELILKEDNDGLRQQGLNTLQQISGETKLMMPALRKALKEGGVGLRHTVVQLAWQHGGEGLKLLLGALNDKDQGVRQQAGWSLYNVQGTDLSDALPDALPALKHSDQQVRMAVTQLLGRMGEKAIPHLLEALQDKDFNVRWNAVNSLHFQKANAKKIVPTLVELAEKSGDGQTRYVALYGLARMGPEGHGPLFKMLKKEKDDGVRANVLQQLGQFGELPKESLAYLLDGLKDKSPQVRWSSANALGAAGKHAKEVVGPLTKALKDGDQNVRYNALYALSRLGEAGTPGLVEALKDGDDNMRIQVVQQIMYRGKQNKAAVPALIEVLKKSANAQLRWMTCQTFGNMGADAQDAIPALTEALNDSNQTVRQQAQQALNRIPKKQKEKEKEKSK